MSLGYYDAHVRSEALTEHILENYQYFHVHTVLVAAHAPTGYQRTEDLLEYFANLRSETSRRLLTYQIQPRYALGVHPEAEPRRAHTELWEILPHLYGDDVVAMGELHLGTWHDEALLLRQLEIARDLDVPLLATTATRERSRKIRRLLRLAHEVGIKAERILVNHVDYTSFRVVMEAGCWIGVTVGPFHLMPDDAVEMIRRYGESAYGRVVLNSGARIGARDVLAMPKTALLLVEAGVPLARVQAMVQDNAARIFEVRDDQVSTAMRKSC